LFYRILRYPIITSMNKFKTKLQQTFTIITLISLMLLFSYTAISKLLEQDTFIFQMKLSPLTLMKTLAPMLAWLLPITELNIVGLLFSDRYRRAGLWCTIILLSIFEIYIAGMLISNQHLPCTCGGIISMLSWKGHLVFNGAFIVSAYVSLVFNKPVHTSMHPFQRIFNASRSENRL